MSKSKLTEACYNQKLDEVRKLIADGAAVDGSENEKWHGQASGCLDGAPFYTPLGEACRSGYATVEMQMQIVAALLEAAAPVDELNYRTETAFHFAAQIGRAPLIRQIAEAGADLNAVGCMGNAVMTLITSFAPDTPGGQKVDGLRALLSLGVDPQSKDLFGKDLVDEVGDISGNLTSRSLNEKQSGRATLELMELVGEQYPDWEKLQAWLKSARKAYIKGDAKARKAQEKINKLRSEVGEKSFEKKVIRALGKKAARRHDDLRRLTRDLLMAPEVVSHDAWPTMVRGLLNLTVSYPEVTEMFYGESHSIAEMDDDEGGAMDLYADEHMSTVELCLQACQAPGASERDDFAELVKDICTTKNERISFMSFGDEEAAALINDLEEKKHPEAATLRKLAKRCFPYANWR